MVIIARMVVYIGDRVIKIAMEDSTVFIMIAIIIHENVKDVFHMSNHMHNNKDNID